MLVADDSVDIQLLLTRFLTDIGAVVELASNGREAVARVLAAEREARPFDLVLMDLHMPELDGAEAVQELRAAGVQRPVIALTASAYLEDRDRCTQAGYNDFLTKPVDRSQLIQRIATLCGKGAAQPPESPQPPGSPETPGQPAAQVPRREVPDASRTTDFDPGRLLAMVGGDEGAREAVVALFRGNAPPLMRAIQDAVAAGDTAVVRAAAHKIKGMLLNVCAAGAAQLASELESAARAGAHDRFAALTASLAIEIRHVCDAMATHDRSAA